MKYVFVAYPSNSPVVSIVTQDSSDKIYINKFNVDRLNNLNDEKHLFDDIQTAKIVLQLDKDNVNKDPRNIIIVDENDPYILFHPNGVIEYSKLDKERCHRVSVLIKTRWLDSTLTPDLWTGKVRVLRTPSPEELKMFLSEWLSCRKVDSVTFICKELKTQFIYNINLLILKWTRPMEFTCKYADTAIENRFTGKISWHDEASDKRKMWMTQEYKQMISQEVVS